MLAGHTTAAGNASSACSAASVSIVLAQALLVGHEGASAIEDVADGGALKGTQLPAEPLDVQLGVVGQRQRDRRLGPRLVVLERLEPASGVVGDADARVGLEQLAQRQGERGIAGNGEHLGLDVKGAGLRPLVGDGGLGQCREVVGGSEQPVRVQLEALLVLFVAPELQRRAGGNPAVAQRRQGGGGGPVGLDRGAAGEQVGRHRLGAYDQGHAVPSLGDVEQLTPRRAVQRVHHEARLPLVLGDGRQRRPGVLVGVQPAGDRVADRQPRVLIEQPGHRRRVRGRGGHRPRALDEVEAPARQPLDRGVERLVGREGEDELVAAGAVRIHTSAAPARARSSSCAMSTTCSPTAWVKAARKVTLWRRARSDPLVVGGRCGGEPVGRARGARSVSPTAPPPSRTSWKGLEHVRFERAGGRPRRASGQAPSQDRRRHHAHGRLVGVFHHADAEAG